MKTSPVFHYRLGQHHPFRWCWIPMEYVQRGLKGEAGRGCVTIPLSKFPFPQTHVSLSCFWMGETLQGETLLSEPPKQKIGSFMSVLSILEELFCFCSMDVMHMWVRETIVHWLPTGTWAEPSPSPLPSSQLSHIFASSVPGTLSHDRLSCSPAHQQCSSPLLFW